MKIGPVVAGIALLLAGVVGFVIGRLSMPHTEAEILQQQAARDRAAVEASIAQSQRNYASTMGTDIDPNLVDHDDAR